jgi:predicted PolB exonuclease-like 3'-5' exonuclease
MFNFRFKATAHNELNRMLKVASRLKRLTEDKSSGWGDFCNILNGYSNNMLDYKKRVNLSMASDEEIEMLKLYDRDIWLINNYIKKIPALFIDNLESEIKKRQQEAEATQEQSI